MELKDILARIGYVRNQANLSAREVSLRMGMSHQYITHIEAGRIKLTMDKLLQFLKVCNCPLEKFFYENPNDYEKDKEISNLIKSLPSDKKTHIIELLKK